MSADSAPLLPSLYTGLEAGEEECQPISIVFFFYNWWWLELGRWFRIATRTHMLARLFIMLTNSHNRVMGNS